MKKQSKALLITILGFIVFGALLYTGITFLKQQSDPALWGEVWRFVLLFLLLIYIIFSPVIYAITKEEL
jgi:DMSO/TMAO reductase YedYZ heme-binding membrane subunit